MPSRVKLVRKAPLPADVEMLLRIAAGDKAAERDASRRSGRPPDVVRNASTFFIEQILLHPEADSYRVLGVGPEASNGELRHNMALLLKWLHPDVDRSGERALFVTRVTRAWDDLKTPAKRALHDSERAKLRERRARSGNGSKTRSRGKVPGRVLVPVPPAPKPNFLRRVILHLLGRS
jgi:hypothetical protein